MLDSMLKTFTETSFGIAVLKIFVTCSGDKSCKKCSEEDKENEEQVKHEKDNTSSSSNSLESEITEIGRAHV